MPYLSNLAVYMQEFSGATVKFGDVLNLDSIRSVAFQVVGGLWLAVGTGLDATVCGISNL